MVHISVCRLKVKMASNRKSKRAIDMESKDLTTCCACFDAFSNGNTNHILFPVSTICVRRSMVVYSSHALTKLYLYSLLYSALIITNNLLFPSTSYGSKLRESCYLPQVSTSSCRQELFLALIFAQTTLHLTFCSC